MDEMIKKVIEVEKACSEDIEKARLEFKKKIETLRFELENKKAWLKTENIESNRKRFKSAVEEANRQVKEKLNGIHKEKGLLIQDRELCEEIKEKIVLIVLGT